ncbi:MAG: hypothetical protein IMY85_01375 [Chloroflexi bacterium]|nr:hypothetical protein [Chloroflexota bacterium]
MKLSTLILIMTILSLVWGAGFLLLPVQIWSLYGIDLDSGGIYMARQLGTVFFMLGAILWFTRSDLSSQSLRGIVIGLFIGNVIGFIVSLIGQLSAGISALGWVAVATYLLLALGFGYHLVKPMGVIKAGPVS